MGVFRNLTANTNVNRGDVAITAIYRGSVLLFNSIVADVDAQAFITATGITNNTQKTAVNTLVESLKANNLWGKMKAIYPMVGGTATTHKFNLKDPRDLDVAFRLQFFGGWTHSNNGIKTNKSNSYADTFLIPDTHFQSQYMSMGHYERVNYISGGTNINGVSNGNIKRLDYGSDNGVETLFIAVGCENSDIGSNQTFSTGLQVATRQAPNLSKFFLNNVLKVQGTKPFVGNPTYAYVLAARRQLLEIQYFSNNQEHAFSFIGESLSDLDVANLTNIVQQFQITLNRQV